ncbi:MAG TPA: hypothetical protein VF657_13500 [Actinoplanes sp.]|jgi:hypothetical protein
MSTDGSRAAADSPHDTVPHRCPAAGAVPASQRRPPQDEISTWSVRDRIGATAAGTGVAGLLLVVCMALLDAPATAYGAIGTIGAGAVGAVAVYLGRR